jgi:hypothetical protein
MISNLTRFLFVFAICLGAALCCAAQAGADNQTSVIPRQSEPNDRPRNIKESLEKMRIEKEKRDFERMIERGEEAVRITEELEVSFEKKGRLTEKEMAKLAAIEKLAKQIRSDLGGDDDKKEQVRPHGESFSFMDAIRSLRSSTQDLFCELKKSSRFTVSAAAIQSSNAVLRLARFIRIAQ